MDDMPMGGTTPAADGAAPMGAPAADVDHNAADHDKMHCPVCTPGAMPAMPAGDSPAAPAA